MDRQTEILGGRRAAGKDARPRVGCYLKQGPSPRLRLLRSARNDMRAGGAAIWGLPGGGRGRENTKQSQFARSRIRAKSFAGKGL